MSDRKRERRRGGGEEEAKSGTKKKKKNPRMMMKKEGGGVPPEKEKGEGARKKRRGQHAHHDVPKELLDGGVGSLQLAALHAGLPVNPKAEFHLWRGVLQCSRGGGGRGSRAHTLMHARAHTQGSTNLHPRQGKRGLA